MDYIVIRGELPGAPRLPGAEAFDVGTPDAGVTVESLETRRDAAEVARDPRTIGFARSMPLKLIEPFDESTNAAATVDTWGIEAVGANTSTLSGKGVKIAVLDTGLMKDWKTHPAFKDFEILEKSFVNDAATHDENGHGTHCAGTIFGHDVDNKRIGIARNATPIIGKVLGRRGGTTAGLFQAMQWAQQQGADIVSMSLGFDFPGMVQELIDEDLPADLAASLALEAYGANLRAFEALLRMFEGAAPAMGRSRPLVIAAAGNESRVVKQQTIRIAPSLPSASYGVVSVGALEQLDGALSIAEFSNGTPKIAAPGVDIWSVNSKTGGMKRMSGTSMACPHVTGVAALWWEQEKRRPGAAPEDLAAAVNMLLLRNAKRSGLSVPEEAGAGLVQAPL